MPRGRPKGSKNKIKTQTVEVATKKRGRPSGSKNKTTAVEPTITAEASTKRGRPVGSINVPKVDHVPEPIRGFQEVMAAFGLKAYLNYSNIIKMELLPEDMEKAVEKYRNKFHVMPTRAILNYKNEKLLPYLHAQISDIDCGLVPSTATWEIKFQYP